MNASEGFRTTCPVYQHFYRSAEIERAVGAYGIEASEPSVKIFPCSAALAVVNFAHTADIREESAGISFVYCLQRERPDNSVGFHADSGLDPADGGWSGGPYPIDYDIGDCLRPDVVCFHPVPEHCLENILPFSESNAPEIRFCRGWHGSASSVSSECGEGHVDHRRSSGIVRVIAPTFSGCYLKLFFQRKEQVAAVFSVDSGRKMKNEWNKNPMVCHIFFTAKLRAQILRIFLFRHFIQ